MRTLITSAKPTQGLVEPRLRAGHVRATCGHPLFLPISVGWVPSQSRSFYTRKTTFQRLVRSFQQ